MFEDKMWTLSLSFVFLLLAFQPSLGLIPKPAEMTCSSAWSLLRPISLRVYNNRPSCHTVQEATKRFFDSIRSSTRGQVLIVPPTELKSEIILMQIQIDLPCDETSQPEYPVFTSSQNESYVLTIAGENGSGKIDIQARTLWGAINALTSLQQLVGRTDSGQTFIRACRIYDYPRFPHRGFLVDSSRHYLSIPVIEQFLDAMASVKMNVFHWHIVDDESFPYDSYTFPFMSQMGAYETYRAIYTQLDVKHVINYARKRGIRVMPEFDTPGHSQSWGKANPGLLTPCYIKNYYDTISRPDGTYGPMDPTREETYDFLKRFFSEVINVFPDNYIHLGGDEVAFDCWRSNPNVTDFMAKMGLQTYEELMNYFVKRLGDVMQGLPEKKTMVFWEEVYGNKAMASLNDVIQVWINPNRFPSQFAEMTAQGYRVLLSAPWYLNYISYGSDVERYYNVDPTNFNGTAEQKALVLGGEASMWGEYVDDTNLVSRSWPRGAPVAERLWSRAEVKDTRDFLARLKTYTCYLRSIGINAQPVNGYSYCD